MLVIPAIDLMKGRVVRLSRGDPNTATFYDKWGTPAEVALMWKNEGAKRLHIIDLDSAFSVGNNTSVVAEIARISKIPIQAGGGIRNLNIAEKLLQAGVTYIILGSLAFSNTGAVRSILKKFGTKRIIVALDNRNGRVMVEGWNTETQFTMTEALEKFSDLGVSCFLVTSIVQDGMLQGPDLEVLQEATAYPDVDIIAAGGVGSVKDLFALKKIGVEGVVVGKALYEGKFSLREAIEALED